MDSQHPSAPSPPASGLPTPASGRPHSPVAPLLVGADEAARLVGVSRSTWWANHAAGLVPSPVRLGGRTLWRVAELHAWVAAGCPPRTRWRPPGTVAR